MYLKADITSKRSSFSHATFEKPNKKSDQFEGVLRASIALSILEAHHQLAQLHLHLDRNALNFYIRLQKSHAKLPR